MAGEILVPTKGGKASDDAVTLACTLARSRKSKIRIIHVIEVERTLPLDAELEPELRRGEEVLSRAERIGRENNCPVETELLQAREVGPAIVDEASERGVDLIIMGIDYKRRFGEFELGKTVPYVLKHAPCQVWLCREAAG
ncbi:MAG: universal stress protein [Chloroflexi bacterium]|nr:universal stress protein [Chloroflexota bacterium]